jgi:hypothetical protein
MSNRVISTAISYGIAPGSWLSLRHGGAYRFPGGDFCIGVYIHAKDHSARLDGIDIEGELADLEQFVNLLQKGVESAKAQLAQAIDRDKAQLARAEEVPTTPVNRIPVWTGKSWAAIEEVPA